jgi:hypothetical protein
MSIKLGLLASSQQQGSALLLDDYPGAAAAYSFRKLRTAYTGNCIRVYSTGSGNPSMDIGFVNNVLDTATLLTFIGINNGIVTTWYDQSGNGNNISQLNTNDAGLIVISGSLVTDNGKPAITRFSPYSLLSAIVPNTSYSGFAVMSRTTSNGFMTSFSGSERPIISLAYSNGILYNNNKINDIFYAFTSTGRFLFSLINASNVQNAYLNNIIKTVETRSSSGSGDFIKIFGRSAVEGFELTGKTQEQILYNTNQSANNSGINTNINTFYSIY